MLRAGGETVCCKCQCHTVRSPYSTVAVATVVEADVRQLELQDQQSSANYVVLGGSNYTM